MPWVESVFARSFFSVLVFLPRYWRDNKRTLRGTLALLVFVLLLGVLARATWLVVPWQARASVVALATTPAPNWLVLLLFVVAISTSVAISAKVGRPAHAEQEAAPTDSTRSDILSLSLEHRELLFRLLHVPDCALAWRSQRDALDDEKTWNRLVAVLDTKLRVVDTTDDGYERSVRIRSWARPYLFELDQEDLLVPKTSRNTIAGPK